MSTESSGEPTVVVGPLAIVGLAALWHGVRRRKLIALGVGIAAVLAEFGSSYYRSFKRR